MTPRVVRTVEELEALPVETALHDRYGRLHWVSAPERLNEKFPWESQPNLLESPDSLHEMTEGLAMYGPLTVLAPPSATLHPRTVTKADIEKVMDAIDDALSSVCVSAQAIKCDCPSDDQIKVVLNAALTALGFEVVDGE